MAGLVLRFLQARLAFLAVLSLTTALLMAQLSPYFLNADNLLGMTRFGAVLGLLALGQTLVIISGRGGIDLSIGAMLSLSGVFFGTLATTAELPIPVAILATLAFGLLLGSVNGLLVTVVGIQPIIATLGTFYLYGSLALVWTNGVPISGFTPEFGMIGQQATLGVPNQVLLVLAPVALVLSYVVGHTVFGRSIFLIGINQTASALSGLNVAATRVAVYAISGLVAAMGSIVTASWLLAARPGAGAGYELQSITVVVLGGTAIMGGAGSLAATLLAVLIVTMIGSGLQLANFNAIIQLAVLGILLLSAVVLNQFLLSRRAQRPPVRPATAGEFSQPAGSDGQALHE